MPLMINGTLIDLRTSLIYPGCTKDARSARDTSKRPGMWARSDCRHGRHGRSATATATRAAAAHGLTRFRIDGAAAAARAAHAAAKVAIVKITLVHRGLLIDGDDDRLRAQVLVAHERIA